MPFKRFVRERPPSEIDRASVFRVRRMLIAVTFALVLLHGHFVKFQTAGTIPVLGLPYYDANLVGTTIALWLVWTWALLRFWQYQRTFISLENEYLFEIECQRLATEHVLEKARQAVARGELRYRHGSEVKEPVHFETGELQYDPARSWILPVFPIYRECGFLVRRGPDEGVEYGIEPRDFELMKQRARLITKGSRPHYLDYKGPLLLSMLAPVFGLIELLGAFC